MPTELNEYRSKHLELSETVVKSNQKRISVSERNGHQTEAFLDTRGQTSVMCE